MEKKKEEPIKGEEKKEEPTLQSVLAELTKYREENEKLVKDNKELVALIMKGGKSEGIKEEEPKEEPKRGEFADKVFGELNKIRI